MASTVRGFIEVGESESVCLLSKAIPTRHELNKKLAGNKAPHSLHVITSSWQDFMMNSLTWKQSHLHKHVGVDRISGESED